MHNLRKLSVWPSSQWLLGQLRRQLYPSDVSVGRISCRVHLRNMWKLLVWNISARVQRQLSGKLRKLRFREIQVIVGIRVLLDLWRLPAWRISSRVQWQLGGKLLKLRFRKIQIEFGI